MVQQKSDYQIHIIQKVKLLRQSMGTSQQQLAQIIDVTNGQVGNIESLRYPHKYTLKHLTLLARHFAIPVESLFLEEGETSLTTSECIDRIAEYLS